MQLDLDSEEGVGEQIVITNEITFLRELKVCDNVAQLHAVYIKKKSKAPNEGS